MAKEAVSAPAKPTEPAGKRRVDYFSETGSRQLAERIRKYWAAAGFTVDVTAIRIPGTETWTITSNLCGGLPPAETLRIAPGPDPAANPAAVARVELAAGRTRTEVGRMLENRFRCLPRSALREAMARRCSCWR